VAKGDPLYSQDAETRPGAVDYIINWIKNVKNPRVAVIDTLGPVAAARIRSTSSTMTKSRACRRSRPNIASRSSSFTTRASLTLMIRST
jgi:hypothetical protein